MKLGGLITADLSDSVFIGELSLDGKLAPVNGALSMVLTAAQNGEASPHLHGELPSRWERLSFQPAYNR